MACTGVWIVWLALVVVQLGFGAYGVIVSKFAKENQADPFYPDSRCRMLPGASVGCFCL